MKPLSKFAVILSSVLLLFALLVGGLLRLYINQDWVAPEYEKLDIYARSGFTVGQAEHVLRAMLDYSIGGIDSLDQVYISGNSGEAFFNQKELSHMDDVQKLTVSVMKLGLVSLIAGGLLYVFGIFSLGANDALKLFAKSFFITLGVVAAFIIAFGIWIAVDFDSFWTEFHVVFLDLESSTFDPAVSNMIRICPGELFSDIIGRFALAAGLALILPVGLCVFYLALKNREDQGDFVTKILLALYSLSILGYISYFLTDIHSFMYAAAPTLFAASVISIVRFIIKRKAKKA